MHLSDYDDFAAGHCPAITRLPGIVRILDQYLDIVEPHLDRIMERMDRIEPHLPYILLHLVPGLRPDPAAVLLSCSRFA